MFYAAWEIVKAFYHIVGVLLLVLFGLSPLFIIFTLIDDDLRNELWGDFIERFKKS